MRQIQELAAVPREVKRLPSLVREQMTRKQTSEDTYGGLEDLRFRVRVKLDVVYGIPHGPFEPCGVIQHHKCVEDIDECDGEVAVHIIRPYVDRICKIRTAPFT